MFSLTSAEGRPCHRPKLVTPNVERPFHIQLHAVNKSFLSLMDTCQYNIMRVSTSGQSATNLNVGVGSAVAIVSIIVGALSTTAVIYCVAVFRRRNRKNSDNNCSNAPNLTPPFPLHVSSSRQKKKWNMRKCL